MLNRKEVMNRKVSFGLFSILMGALAFNVSTPQAQRLNLAETSTVELSSESGECDYAQRLRAAGTSITCDAHQTVNSKAVNGTVTVEVAEQDVADRLTNPNAAPKLERYLKVSMELETECTDGCAGGKRRTITRFDQELSQIGKLNQLIKAKFEEDAKRMAGENEAAKKLAVQREQCLVDESGAKIEATERLNCRMDKLAEMSEEKAAAYYEKYIQPELEGLVESDNARDQAKGTRLLAKLGRGRIGGKFVQESIGDLKKFQQYRAQALAAKNNILKLNANDPRRAAMVQRFRQGEATADAYFKNRGLKVPNERWPENSNFDFAGSLGGDLERYRSQLDQDFQSYDQIVTQHRQMVGANGSTTDDGSDLASGGRTARGQVGTGSQQTRPTPLFPAQNQAFRGNTSNNGQPRIR